MKVETNTTIMFFDSTETIHIRITVTYVSSIHAKTIGAQEFRSIVAFYKIKENLLKFWKISYNFQKDNDKQLSPPPIASLILIFLTTNSIDTCPIIPQDISLWTVPLIFTNYSCKLISQVINNSTQIWLFKYCLVNVALSQSV